MTTNTFDEYVEDISYYIIQEIQQDEETTTSISRGHIEEIYSFGNDETLVYKKYNGIITNYIIN